jgi:hypothetical protein
MEYIPYAYLKTIDGGEVKEYTQEAFESAVKEIETRVVEKSDRTLYFVTQNCTINGIKFYKDDYFEVLNSRK